MGIPITVSCSFPRRLASDLHPPEVNQSGGQIVVRALLYPAWHESFAQLVTMDTRPQGGAGPSNSFDTGYELGFPAAADVWRLACCTAEYLARHYPAGVRRGGEPVGISRARIDAGSRQMMRVAPLPVDDTACYSFLQVGRRPSALLANYKAFSKLGVKSLVVV